MMRMAEIAGKSIQGTITAAERQVLETWLSQSAHNRKLFERMQDKDYRQKLLKEIEERDPALAWNKAKEQLHRKQRIKRQKKVYRYLAAAAIAVLVCGGLMYLLSLNQRQTQPQLTINQDVPPGGTKARLILANGQSLQLSDNSDSTFMQGNHVKVRQLNGRLAYNFTGSTNELTLYNTLITPKGGEYRITLEDGTNIWLNAASRLRFPAHFAGRERRVELTGEAYFQVKHDNKHPFTVVVNGVEIHDLGTEFNVRAYNDETTVKTTLIAGALSVTSGNDSVNIRPGKMAVSTASGTTLSDVNIKQVTAWKNDLFLFKNTPIPDLMKDLSRWYNIEVVYAPGYNPLANFTGEISRKVPISKLLDMMELTSVARFKISGRTITVLPYK
jgi:ferric-dicitrate binding protein FerR (iron transport regulator)